MAMDAKIAESYNKKQEQTERQKSENVKLIRFSHIAAV